MSREIWTPQHSSHALYLACPVKEVLLDGDRGAGKSELLIVDFLQHVGQGFGPAWHGVIFRQTYPQLDELIKRSRSIIPRIFPTAKYNRSSHEWQFEGGERLDFRYALTESDYWNYHGGERPFLGFDELTTWPNLNLYLMLHSICRSSNPMLPRKIRATTNPWGAGHGAVKARFVDPAPAGRVIQEPYEDTITGAKETRERARITVRLRDNLKLLKADPSYVGNLQVQSEAQRKAWLHADWDIVAGGVFDGCWDASVHVLPQFEIPRSWSIYRSFDWGGGAPYSVGWWAIADRSPARMADGNERHFFPGTMIRVCELYGWNGKPNIGTGEVNSKIAANILERENSAIILRGRQVRPGAADRQIYDVINGKSMASEFEACGVRFVEAPKGSGSRVTGWQLMRDRMEASKKRPMERPGLFVFDTCREGFLRTVPTLPRDPKKPDDADTAAEDHCFVGETLVTTSAGVSRLSDLPAYGEIWTDTGWRRFERPRNTRDDAELVAVELANGAREVCTPDHLWLTDSGWRRADQLGECVVSVTPVGRGAVWCLTVPGLERFALASGPIVHNCADESRYQCALVSTETSMVPLWV